jgi:N utilization substance protein B
MLNRRYLRIKVMQYLYAFFQSSKNDLVLGEKELFTGFDKIYNLYISQLSLLCELKHVAKIVSEEAKTKHLPTKDNLNPNLKFIENKFIKLLEENIQFKTEVKNRKISWSNEFDLIKNIFNVVKSSPEYDLYMNSKDDDFSTHKKFIASIFRECIADHELLNHYYEERDLYWGEDIYIVNPIILKTIYSFEEGSNPFFSLVPLYKDKEEDEIFAKNLFLQTILRNDEIEKLIKEKTKNWELERIAAMDMLLMKMAISEIIQFSGIPVKVTLNEYIEISKTYSSPESKSFINGILDKIVIDLKNDNKFFKIGRGLKDNKPN